MRKQINQKIKDLEKRSTPIQYSELSVTAKGNLEIREKITGGLKDRIVKGYGVVWGSKNSHGEMFVRGCFAKSIKELGPGSDSKYQLKFRDRHGKSLANFSVLIEDEIGLYFETKPLDKINAADELLVQLESGTINNFSIGFNHDWDKVEWDDENDALVNIEARLFEISAVDIPSDIETYQVRSGEELEYLQDDIEEFIYDLPKSKQLEARKIITRCMTLGTTEPQEQRETALETNKPAETGLDLDYLIKNL